MEPKNLLYIMSDEHNPRMLGCAGHEIVKTPNLDRLAARGTRFTSAYTNSPICVPARASWATGRYVHAIGYWDNAHAYDGRIRGWGHRLQGEGIPVNAIGKLHYRNATDLTGFDSQTEPMHIADGIGQVWGSVRDPLPEMQARAAGGGLLAKAGPGLSSYNRFDARIADTACARLRDAAGDPDGGPWVLFLGFVAPHFPLTVPEEFHALYPPDDLPLPKLDPRDGHERHPWIQSRPNLRGAEPPSPELNRKGLAAYLGLCTFIDAEIGRVLGVLEETGLAASTRVVYTSDHGDNAGTRGLWGKGNFYTESAGIPLIVAGPDVPEGAVRRTPVTLVDSYQTILDCVGLTPTEEERDLPGRSWFKISGEADAPERAAFSEYHAIGSPSAGFMIRQGRYKYHHYVGFPPELFDLADDAEELRDLAPDPAWEGVLKEMEAELRAVIDPKKAEGMAKADQRALIERFGGREKALTIGTRGETPAPEH